MRERIFISHSSHDNHESIAFSRWLTEIGYDQRDVFLDVKSIHAGEVWRERLVEANSRCEAVVVLASPTALASEEVGKEIDLARDLRKPVFVAILYGLEVTDERLGRLRDLQLVKLDAQPTTKTYEVKHVDRAADAEVVKTIGFNENALAKLRVSLERHGLAADHFSWRPPEGESPNPYPGLRGFSTNDAGIFFGRDPEINAGIGRMRELRTIGDGRLFVIEAASGAGKSSYLKAGLWPRLMRDHEFEPLEILRPSGGMIAGPNGLARIAEHLGDDVAQAAAALTGPIEQARATYADLLKRFAKGAKEARTDVEGLDLVDAPTLVFGVDQAEELFVEGAAPETERFFELLKGSAKLRRAIRPVYILTLRAESVGALVSTVGRHELPPIAQIALPAIPRERFLDVIREPARVAAQVGLNLTIENTLVQELLNDSAGADALPWLAVTLEQMVEERLNGEDVTLTLEDYLKGGRLEGALETRLGSAMADAQALKPEVDMQAALRRLMIPHLATWGEAGAKRLVGLEREVVDGDKDLELLVDQMVNKHLLTQSRDKEGRVLLEVAHEALLRRPPIDGWLRNNKDFLSWLQRVESARELDEKNVGQNIFDEPSDKVVKWLSEHEQEIGERARTFVEDALEETDRRAEAAKRLAARTQLGLAVLLAFTLNFVGVGYVAYSQKAEADERLDALCATAAARDAPAACAPGERG